MSIQLTINLTIYCIILLNSNVVFFFKKGRIHVRTCQVPKIIGLKLTHKKVILSLYLPNGAQNYWAPVPDIFFFKWIYLFIYLFIYR